jgi:Lar family restriction alleviation protein
MATKRALKPCPFCGEASNLHMVAETRTWKYVWCGKCDAQGPAKSAKSRAIDTWNERH